MHSRVYQQVLMLSQTIDVVETAPRQVQHPRKHTIGQYLRLLQAQSYYSNSGLPQQ